MRGKGSKLIYHLVTCLGGGIRVGTTVNHLGRRYAKPRTLKSL